MCEEVDADDPDRARAGLPLRAGAEDDPRAAAARDDPHLLAHPLAERRALRHLPVARGAPRGAARLEHRRLSHPAALQQLHRFGATASSRAGIDREHNAVVQQGARRRWCAPTRSPSSGPCRWLARRAAGRRVPRARCRRELGLAPDALLGVGVDRLDYTKGIEERLAGGRRLLERYPDFRGRFTFVQLAAPSRTKIERYRELNEQVESARRAHQRKRFGTARYRPIMLLRSHHEPPDGVPVLPGRRPLLRVQPARRHEPRRQGVRRRARRRAGRAGAEPVHRRGARAHRGAGREPLRPRRRRATALAAALAHARRPSSGSACAPCAAASRSSTSTAGRAACSWTPPSCAASERHLRPPHRLPSSAAEVRMSALLAAATRRSSTRARVLRTCSWPSTSTARWRPSSATPTRRDARTHPPAARAACAALYPVRVISGRAAARRSPAARGRGCSNVVGNHGLEPWRRPASSPGEVARAGAQARAGARPSCRRGHRGQALLAGAPLPEARRQTKVAERHPASAAGLARAGAHRAGQAGGQRPPEGAPNKGEALERCAGRRLATRALYVGDDVTDEDVFRLDQPGRLLDRPRRRIVAVTSRVFSAGPDGDRPPPRQDGGPPG